MLLLIFTGIINKYLRIFTEVGIFILRTVVFHQDLQAAFIRQLLAAAESTNTGFMVCRPRDFVAPDRTDILNYSISASPNASVSSVWMNVVFQIQLCSVLLGLFQKLCKTVTCPHSHNQSINHTGLKFTCKQFLS